MAFGESHEKPRDDIVEVHAQIKKPWGGKVEVDWDDLVDEGECDESEDGHLVNTGYLLGFFGQRVGKYHICRRCNQYAVRDISESDYV